MARLLGLGLLLVTLAACGGDDGSGPDPDAGLQDSGGSGGSGGVGGTGGVGGNGGTGGAAPIECANASDCDDGVYCNGSETCDATDENADPLTGCVAGTLVVCDDAIACTTDTCSETTDACTFVAPDADSDGHTDAACLDDQNDPLGDDCDDDDAARFPGNPELCDRIDQDCDATTFGTTDNDGDGSVDAACCNTDDNDVERCGLDCDDTDIARHARQPEFCDGIDNDCDVAIDEVQNAVAWYRDLDMDGFGVPGSPTVSCTPQPGRSLVATDCNDTDANVKPNASEVCDDEDNNCNAYVDEWLNGCVTSEDVTGVVINECLNGLDDCGNYATCEDARESFTCACAPGFIGDGITCTPIDDCSVDNGGCDPLTTCTSNPNGPETCGACPTYYVGTGSAGCVPTLITLAVSPGVLRPALGPVGLTYDVAVAIDVETVMLTPTVPAGATVTIDGDAVVSGVAWQSPMLDLGGNAFTVVVSQVGHPSRTYTITISRAQNQEAYLKGQSGVASDYFGRSVAISGDTIVIGAENEDGITTNTGSAYVFVRSGTAWTQQARLQSLNPGSADAFGNAVAISGDTIVVGMAGDDSSATGVNGSQTNNSLSGSGAVFVFVRSGTTWTEQAFIKANVTGAGDAFGTDVAIDGDTIVVSAPSEDSAAMGVDGNAADNSASGSGAVYVFVRSGVSWLQQAYLKASNTQASDLFGDSIAISGDTIVVGASQEDSLTADDQTSNAAASSGAAYVFTRSGANWFQTAFLKASNVGASDYFGSAVAVSGDTIAVGSPSEDSEATGVNGSQGGNAASGSGAVYVFEYDGLVWSQEAYVKASNTGGGDDFGSEIALNDDTLVVGAYAEDGSDTGVNGNALNNAASTSGAAYVFGREPSGWFQRSYLKASNTATNDRFGTAVAVSGDTAVVGAYAEDSNATGVNGDQTNNSATDNGAVYVFR